MEINKLEIILVEDNPADAKFAIMALKKAKLSNDIVHLKDGEEALNYFFGIDVQNPDKRNSVGLVLLDLKMPKVNGLEVLKKLKADERTKNIPVAVFTSSKEDPDVKQCYELGVNSYIVKPIDFEQFSQVVKDTGLYWLLINHLPEK